MSDSQASFTWEEEDRHECINSSDMLIWHKNWVEQHVLEGCHSEWQLSHWWVNEEESRRRVQSMMERQGTVMLQSLSHRHAKIFRLNIMCLFSQCVKSYFSIDFTVKQKLGFKPLFDLHHSQLFFFPPLSFLPVFRPVDIFGIPSSVTH